MIQLYQGDCLEVMRTLPDKCVDMVLCDIPYGEVSQKSAGLRKLDRCDADRCDIDLPTMIEQFDRLCGGSMYVFCGTEQISDLVRLLRRCSMTVRVGAWEKTNPSPMNGTRLWLSGLEFCVFGRKSNATFNAHCKKALWRFPSGRSKIHPTEKPVTLMEELILASSDSGDMVLDNTMGSGTTGVACMNTGRRFIGIERDEGYFKIAQDRINAAMPIPDWLKIQSAN